MEGGYINEGGQLKTKNGQKYVVNKQPDGIFISKTCAILTALIAVLAMITVILLTYFLMAGKVENCESIRILRPSDSGTVNENGTVLSASIIGSSAISNGNFYPQTSSEHGLLADEESKTINKKIQLYEGWNPLLYSLHIEPHIDSSSSNGTIWIDISKDPKFTGFQPIVLNIFNITINQAELRHKTAKESLELEIETSYGQGNETFIVEILSELKQYEDQILTLKLEFVSELTDTLQGFYKTSYQNFYTGAKEWVTSTQFSPIDARRAFPCFDRPDKKAQFSITIIRPQEYTMALSNMPSKSMTVDRPGFIKEEFEITPKMSTYLVAFIVSNLTKTNQTDQSRTSPKIEIWTRPEASGYTNYAYSVTKRLIPFYEKFFGIPFNLPKIDLVAVPDFGFGAMENWGLITFRDSALLVPEKNEQSSSAAHKQYVASIIAHEIAHQWFGNLVTPKWWDDLWLKEGFATFMSFLATDEIQPEWDYWSNIAVRTTQAAMLKDSDESSHPISFPVSSSVDIRRIFDPISYSKGAVIIRMMRAFLGHEAFGAAIKDYLKTFSYGNAMKDDLWKFMSEFGHKFNTLPPDFDVKNIMDSWTLQAGYPVVMVNRSGSNVIISQQRYMLPEKNIKDERQWFIPITFETSERRAANEIPTHWMSNKNKHIIIPDVFSQQNNSNNWIYFNVNRTGYYRVNYDYESWKILKQHFAELPPITRATLLDDSLQLARVEYLNYEVPLTFLLEMGGRVTDRLLWAAGANGIQYLTEMLNREPAYEVYRAFMKFVVRPAYDHYSLVEKPNATDAELLHQAQVVKLACFFSYDRCTNAAQLKYREWMTAPLRNPIKPNLKETIYCSTLREGSFQEWYFAYKRYKETTSASEKEQILSALGCTSQPWLLSKYLNMTLNPDSGIRKQDGVRSFSSVAANTIGYEIAFDFLVTNIKTISEYYGDGFSTLSKMINAVTTFMNKPYQLDQFERFAEKARKLKLKSVESAISLATEQIKNNIFWRKRSYYQLKSVLENAVSYFHINLY